MSPARYEDDRLTISHDLDNKRAWTQCLSLPNIKLPTGYYFGVSATTGDLSDAHDIIGIKTYELDTSPGVAKEERPYVVPEAADVEIKMHQQQKPKEESGASWSGTKKFFVGLIITLAIVALIVIAIMIYQNQQENNRKRFY